MRPSYGASTRTVADCSEEDKDAPQESVRRLPFALKIQPHVIWGALQQKIG
jgi:hypothetical protein